jgi:hypothetical protein
VLHCIGSAPRIGVVCQDAHTRSLLFSCAQIKYVRGSMIFSRESLSSLKLYHLVSNICPLGFQTLGFRLNMYHPVSNICPLGFQTLGFRLNMYHPVRNICPLGLGFTGFRVNNIDRLVSNICPIPAALATSQSVNLNQCTLGTRSSTAHATS